MNKPIISNFLLNGIIIFLLSCNSESKNGIIPQNNFHEDKNEHWSYEGKTGPEHWAEVEKNSNCNNTDSQVKTEKIPSKVKETEE